MQGRSASASSLSVCHANSLLHACSTFAETEVNAYPGSCLSSSVLLRILQLPQIAALSSCADALLKYLFERQQHVLLPHVLIARYDRLSTQK